MPVTPFIPLIAKGAGVLGGIFAGKKAQSAAMQRSPEEQQALSGAQGAAGELATTGQSLTEQGQNTQAPATSYFDTLLRGNRAQMGVATAAPRAAITDIYRGAGRNLEHSGIRGPQADVAKGDLNRQRASQLSSLVTGVQPGAASALTSIGQTQIQQGGARTAGAGSIYDTLLGKGFDNRKYARGEGEKAGTAIGGLIHDTIVGFPNKFGGGPKYPTTSGSADFGSDEWMNH